MRKTYFFIFFFIVVIAGVQSQSNRLIDKLLRQQEATYGETCYVILTAGGFAPEETTVEECLAILESNRWMLPGKQVEDLMSISELCYLLMKSLDMSGGLMYALFPSPRYAFRELTFRGLIDEGTGPFRLVSGNEVIRMVGNVLEWKETYQ